MRRFILAGFATLLSMACQPALRDGVYGCSDGRCPSGLICVEGLCRRAPGQTDGGLDGALDGGVVRCRRDEDCPAAGVCRAARCAEGVCSNEALPAGRACGTSDLCRVGACNGSGECLESDRDCSSLDDLSACSVGGCDPESGCQPAPAPRGTNCATAEQLQWVLRAPTGPRPGSRRWHGMAHDAERRRVVLFGGYRESDGVSLGDTWTWDGVRWAQATSGTAPSPREAMGMAYDTVRQRVVLFGGFGPGGLQDDTWLWDGTTWSEVIPATRPPARQSHRMVYDAARGRIVLFGGFSDTSSLDDTWEWDGTTWIRVGVDAPSPSAREAHAMLYDASTSRVVLFGGSAGADELWHWNGTAWSEVMLTPALPGRRWHAMAWDQVRSRAVVFGGTGIGGLLGDTWTLSGATAEEITPSAPVPAREAHAMVFDAVQSRVLLFGGFDGLVELDDLWELQLVRQECTADRACADCGFRGQPCCPTAPGCGPGLVCTGAVCN